MNCIFSCVFNQEKYLDMFFILLESIFIYGELDYNTQILVYTSTPFMNKIKQSHLFNDEKIKFEINDTFDTIKKSCRARYNIFNLPSTTNYNKILYLDIDILVKDDINNVFYVCKDDILYVLEEGEINSNIDDWGKPLFGNEISTYIDKTAFTSGILLFNNCDKIKDLFNKTIELFDTTEFNLNDQPYLVYTAFKYNLYDNKILKSFAVNNDNNIYSDKVIHHFPGGPGVYQHKIYSMYKFLNNLKDSTIHNNMDKTTVCIDNSGELIEGNINTWNLNNKLCDSNEKLIDQMNYSIRATDKNPTYLLDLAKNNYTFVEKYVYDIAMFHFERLNIHNIEEHYIEFWFRFQCDNHILHVDCDEAKRVHGIFEYPILASVTYLNDFLNNPTIITKVDIDMYNDDKIEDQTELVLSLPKRNKHITFDGKYFHGTTKLSDMQYTTPRYLLAINLWSKKPSTDINHCQNFDTALSPELKTLFDKKTPVVSIQPGGPIGHVNVDNTVINHNLFEDILYNGEFNTACYIFNDLIKKYHQENDANITTFKFKLNDSINEVKIKPELKSNVIHTFIINLKPEINRRLSLVNRLKHTNIKNYTIIDAVDGRKDLDKYDFKVLSDWRFTDLRLSYPTKKKINTGEIGCFLSHYFIWKHMITHNIDIALILEDDCLFFDDFNDKLEKILQISPTKYDFFTLGRNRLPQEAYNLGPEIVIDEEYVIPKYSYNTHSYLITNSGAKILANNFAIKNIIPLDEYIPIMYDSFAFPEYSDYFKNMPKLRAIGLINDITEQNWKITGSSIENQPEYK